MPHYPLNTDIIPQSPVQCGHHTLLTHLMCALNRTYPLNTSIIPQSPVQCGHHTPPTHLMCALNQTYPLNTSIIPQSPVHCGRHTPPTHLMCTLNRTYPLNTGIIPHFRQAHTFSYMWKKSWTYELFSKLESGATTTTVPAFNFTCSLLYLPSPAH